MSLTTPSPDIEGVHPSDAPESSSIRRSESGGRRPPSTSQPSRPSTTPNSRPPQSIIPGVNNRQASTLPYEKVFPIQIGSEIFRLSGASIGSDAPSYFSQFFEEQLREAGENGQIRTLYIDRDPVTFRDIARHLQGYHVKPQDGTHFVKLFADAQFYSLPRLISQLFESEIFIQIGHRNFQIPRDIFSSPGDSPNFFSLGFAVFFSTPGEAFPGLDRRGLLRPPTIVPPSVPNRSGEVFAQLLHLLRGYPLHIRDEDHRQELLRDCRYFHLRGLEQKLIAHEIKYNLQRRRSEISIRLEDIRPSGVSFVTDSGPADQMATGGFVYYARPFVDENAHELIVEIGGESTIVDLQTMRADFQGATKARVASLTQVIANKLNLPNNAPLGLLMLAGGASAQTASPGHTPLSEDQVKIVIDKSTDITLDKDVFEYDGSPIAEYNSSSNNNNNSNIVLSDHNDSETGSLGGISNPSRRSSSGQAGHLASPIYGQNQNFTFGKRPASASLTGGGPPNKRAKQQGGWQNMNQWIVRRGQWRLRVQTTSNTEMVGAGLEIVFIALKLEVFSSERARNNQRGFLN